MTTQSLAYIDISNPLKGKSVFADGWLELKQNELLLDKVDYAFLEPVIDYTGFFKGDITSLSWPMIISNYLNRNCKY